MGMVPQNVCIEPVAKGVGENKIRAPSTMASYGTLASGVPQIPGSPDQVNLLHNAHETKAIGVDEGSVENVLARHGRAKDRRSLWSASKQDIGGATRSSRDKTYGSECGSGRIVIQDIPHTDNPIDGQQSPKRMLHQGSGFFEDLLQFKEGTIPQSIVVASVIGVVCGLAACFYYKILSFFLQYLWHTLPEQYVIDKWSEGCYWLWIPLVGFIMSICVGLTVILLGEPGDLAYTIQCVHDKAYIAMDHVLPMVVASQASILGGGSLGPEAPLVAICAALGGFISRTIFRQKARNVIRKHTLMGMAAALAAFFGCPLGGSLFALEVNSRFGLEYFEHTIEAIFCGEVCLVVFRAAAGLSIGSIWKLGTEPLPDTKPGIVILGALIGLFGAALAACFAAFHFKVMDAFKAMNLLNHKNAVQRAMTGAAVILTLGILFPHTMFWGEYEFQTLWTLSPAKDLVHIFPTTGLFGFEMDSCLKATVVGICKLIAVSFTVSGGYRGGFIFPFFAAGAAFGRALVFLIPSIPTPVACLCFAASINVAITRTSLSSSIILVYLSGEQNAISPVLAASLVSLFATTYMPFIKAQIARNDIDHSIFYEEPEEGKDAGVLVAGAGLVVPAFE